LCHAFVPRPLAAKKGCGLYLGSTHATRGGCRCNRLCLKQFSGPIARGAAGYRWGRDLSSSTRVINSDPRLVGERRRGAYVCQAVRPRLELPAFCFATLAVLRQPLVLGLYFWPLELQQRVGQHDFRGLLIHGFGEKLRRDLLVKRGILRIPGGL